MGWTGHSDIDDCDDNTNETTQAYIHVHTDTQTIKEQVKMTHNLILCLNLTKFQPQHCHGAFFFFFFTIILYHFGVFISNDWLFCLVWIGLFLFYTQVTPTAEYTHCILSTHIQSLETVDCITLKNVTF